MPPTSVEVGDRSGAAAAGEEALMRIAAVLACVVLLPSVGHADCQGFFNGAQARDCEIMKSLMGCGIQRRDAVALLADRPSTEVYIVQLIAKCARASANAAATRAAPNAPPVDSHDWDNRVFSMGYNAGVLRWSQDHCNGLVAAAQIQILHNVRDLDLSKFDAASALGYKESVEFSVQHALEAPDPSDARRWGDNIMCAVTEQDYGPHGAVDWGLDTSAGPTDHGQVGFCSSQSGCTSRSAVRRSANDRRRADDSRRLRVRDRYAVRVNKSYKEGNTEPPSSMGALGPHRAVLLSRKRPADSSTSNGGSNRLEHRQT
jgi:hypothetical protein